MQEPCNTVEKQSQKMHSGGEVIALQNTLLTRQTSLANGSALH